jgi:predicted glycosyl hydrolase (DUF1957 family)
MSARARRRQRHRQEKKQIREGNEEEEAEPRLERVVYPHLHKMAERMCELARRFPNAEGTRRRALNQAAREVMLAQASDWAFIMKTGTTVPYATSAPSTTSHGLRRSTMG